MFRILSNICYYAELLMNFDVLKKLDGDDMSNMAKISVTLLNICRKHNIDTEKIVE